jgi:hypothetical protein
LFSFSSFGGNRLPKKKLMQNDPINSPAITNPAPVPQSSVDPAGHQPDVERDPERREELLKAWVAGEEVAMHFNNLLSGFRLKAIGGIAVGAVVGVGLKLHELANPWIVFCVFLSLTVIWALIYAADFNYYYRLLAGAVDELLRIERRLGNIQLSHFIEIRVQGKVTPPTDLDNIASSQIFRASTAPSSSIKCFYVVPLLILFIATLVSFPRWDFVRAYFAGGK